jgi:hypothetical protein
MKDEAARKVLQGGVTGEDKRTDEAIERPPDRVIESIWRASQLKGNLISRLGPPRPNRKPAEESFAMFCSSIWKWQPTALALVAVLGISSSTNAAETGHWKGRGVLVVTNAPMVKVGDSSDHQVSLIESDGIIFDEGGQSFLPNARYQVVGLNDSGGMVSGGYKTFTTDDGSQVFAKYKVIGGSRPTFNGEWTFVGGTKKYKGISGNGKFTVTWVSDTAAWDLLEGDYTIP